MSKIKLIIFDLDGVLVEAKQIHYDTLNKALKEIKQCVCVCANCHRKIHAGLLLAPKLI